MKKEILSLNHFYKASSFVPKDYFNLSATSSVWFYQPTKIIFFPDKNGSSYHQIEKLLLNLEYLIKDKQLEIY